MDMLGDFLTVMVNQMSKEVQPYSITKSFLEKYAFSLRMEVNNLGVKVFGYDAQRNQYVMNLESKGIKSHHNVGGLPEDLEFDLVEPIKLLYKEI